MSEFKNKSFRLIKIMEIYTILSSKLLKGRKFLLLRYKGTSSNTSGKHFWGKAVKRIKTSLKNIMHYGYLRKWKSRTSEKGFCASVTRKETRAFWTFQSPPVRRWFCHFPFVISFRPIEDFFFTHYCVIHLNAYFFLWKLKNKWQCHLLDTYKIWEQTTTTKFITNSHFLSSFLTKAES